MHRIRCFLNKDYTHFSTSQDTQKEWASRDDRSGRKAVALLCIQNIHENTGFLREPLYGVEARL